jgi:hypothetical protein
MTAQYRSFQVTIPAGTPQASPVVINTQFEPLAVDQIDIRIPPGPLGQMGFQIASSRQQVIPWNAGQFIIANDEPLSFPSTNYPDSGDWQVIGFNTGVFNHSIWVRFALRPVTPAATPVVGISVSALSTLVAPAPAPALSPSDILAGPPPTEFDVSAPLP